MHTIHDLVMIRCYEECVAPWLTDLHSDDDKSAAKLLLQKFLTIKK